MTSHRDHTSIRHGLRAFLEPFHSFLTLRQETDYSGTTALIREDAEFTSGTLFALVFAILIASIGLNVNSTAVIIGAMLISPLMGPIIGAGFALGTNDVTLLRLSVRNLVLAAFVSLATSTLYFLLSPLGEAQSELLARTRPTLYDVLTAVFGGAAGAVALSRKGGKGHVIPGVAIATALMPPLCTAGFGLAQWNPWYFFGALHLFLINALFICLSTLGFIRILRFRRVAPLDPARAARVRNAIAIITLCISLPSIYTAWNIVSETRFQQKARRFVSENLNFADRVIVNVELRYSSQGSTITATLIGEPLADSASQALEGKIPSYGLEDTKLVLRQPIQKQASLAQIGTLVKKGILEDLYKRNSESISKRDVQIGVLQAEVDSLKSISFPVRELAKEVGVLFPTLYSLSIANETVLSDTAHGGREPAVVTAIWRKIPNVSDRKRLQAFITLRLGDTPFRFMNVDSRKQ